MSTRISLTRSDPLSLGPAIIYRTDVLSVISCWQAVPYIVRSWTKPHAHARLRRSPTASTKQTRELNMGREPSKTQRMTVYQLREWGTAFELIQEKYLRNNFQIEEFNTGGDIGWIAYGSLPLKRANWCQVVEGLSGRELDLQNQTCAAVLLIPIDNKTFAVTFGMGWQLLDPAKIEHGFGLRFAIRTLDADDIREVARRTLDSRARIDKSTVPGGQRIGLYGIEEYGEIVSRIVGKAKIDRLSHSNGKSITFSLAGSDALKVPLAKSSTAFIADLRVIADVIDQAPPDPSLEFIDKVQPIQSKDPRVPRLEARLSDALDGKDSDVNLGLSYPWEGEAELAEAESYIIHRGGRISVISSDIDVSDLLETVARTPANHKLTALYNTKVQPCTGPDGDEIIGRAITGDKWIVAELSLGSERFFLHQGKWYEIGTEYSEFLRQRVEQILKPNPAAVMLPAWPRNQVEGDYIDDVADSHPLDFVEFDKKLLHTDMHPRGFEVADLLGPNDDLIHIKRTTTKKGSAPLHHLFAQGCNSIEQIAYDKSARTKLVKKIRELSARDIPDDYRPSQVVFGISLVDRELSPDSLFTFAQIGMVRSVERIERAGATVCFVNIPTL